jgi:hypothetical protein
VNWNPHNGKYGDDPYYITPEEEKKLELDKECQYCDGSGFFYSDPDLGPCNCVLDAVADKAVAEMGEGSGQ